MFVCVQRKTGEEPCDEGPRCHIRSRTVAGVVFRLDGEGNKSEMELRRG